MSYGNRRERGHVLFVTAAAAVVILGMAGLTVDLARMYIGKNELQSYCDAASIAAANRLNGTTAGITNATTEATSNVNRWGFGQDTVGSVTVEFGQNSTGPWVASPNPATGYRFARVGAQGNVTLYFLPVFALVGFSRPVQAGSVAGQTYLGELGDGAFPFSPDAHVPNPVPVDPSGNFGLEIQHS